MPVADKPTTITPNSTILEVQVLSGHRLRYIYDWYIMVHDAWETKDRAWDQFIACVTKHLK